jgi:hypothetical protein
MYWILVLMLTTCHTSSTSNESKVICHQLDAAGFDLIELVRDVRALTWVRTQVRQHPGKLVPCKQRRRMEDLHPSDRQIKNAL